MKDQELFDLCKQVYEATGWDDTEKRHPYGGVTLPLYNSDYLLEKLPKYLEIHGKRADDYLLYLRPNFNTEKWTAYYHGVGEYMPFFIEADTPLKALLKLTIALHKEGLIEDINPNGDDTA